ncbi:hypothetical protein O7623_12100 [Solwaraspora sp. WMMD791]|uniref:hypothetical protein n=1 Tax=Solwaraspora sp. WMMD791 TaxID=3016086 RepID=UPI00249AFC43|nr:hypothetical protein [Solwaraspora sp. WMMD791]WFE29868.1 hypothetical protein O7623_12100 [Solwaraspora sp. WMMD791]
MPDGGLGAVAAGRRSDAPVVSWLLAAALVPATSAVLAATNPLLQHWFLIPVTVCGVLIGVDAVEWLLRRRDVFDPQAILGLFGVHFYYLTPILHVTLDFWPPLLFPSTPDWRAALGAMALLNAVGLAGYRAIVSAPARRVRRASVGPGLPAPADRRDEVRFQRHDEVRFQRHDEGRFLRFDEVRFQRFAVAAIAVGVLAFAALVTLLGGPVDFVTAMAQDRQALAGLGWLLLLSESFPLLLFSLVAVRWRRVLRQHAGLVVLLLVGLVVVQFAVSGLRGSRSSVLWPLVLGLVLVHLVVVPITRKAFFASAAVVVVFVYGYGLYKGAGVEVVDIAKGTRTVEEVSETTGRGLPMVLLGDFGRADIQALLLDRERADAVGWSLGSTYLAAPLSLVPSTLVDVDLRDKSQVGTNALYGPGVYESGLRSERVFGITGEATLNFGPAGALASFGVLGLFLRFACRYHHRARRSSQLTPKLLCVPLCAVTVILVTADLDNILAFYVGEALPLTVVAFCALARRPASVVDNPKVGHYASK